MSKIFLEYILYDQNSYIALYKFNVLMSFIFRSNMCRIVYHGFIIFPFFSICSLKIRTRFCGMLCILFVVCIHLKSNQLLACLVAQPGVLYCLTSDNLWRHQWYHEDLSCIQPFKYICRIMCSLNGVSFTLLAILDASFALTNSGSSGCELVGFCFILLPSLV